jgi:hypothetical protein
MSRLAKLLLLLTVAAGLASTAFAANVHLKKSPPLTFTDQGLTLKATGALTGLGNGDIVVELTAQGQPVSTCTNPSGANQPPGHNPAVVTLGGVQAIPAGSIENGNVGFNVSTVGPTTPIPGAPDCPSSKWREDITDVIFTGFTATIVVKQPCAIANGIETGPCTTVFNQTFTVR